jgi:hypothetical protein
LVGLLKSPILAFALALSLFSAKLPGLLAALDVLSGIEKFFQRIQDGPAIRRDTMSGSKLFPNAILYEQTLQRKIPRRQVVIRRVGITLDIEKHEAAISSPNLSVLLQQVARIQTLIEIYKLVFDDRLESFLFGFFASLMNIARQ